MSASTSSSTNGLLIQYDFCTGCHSCEMACKQEKSLDKGEFGIKVFGYGPAKTPKGSWDFFYMPVPTDICDLCIERTATGKVPACVHHCQPKVMEYGPIDELSKKLADIKKCVLFAPGLD